MRIYACQMVFANDYHLHLKNLLIEANLRARFSNPMETSLKSDTLKNEITTRMTFLRFPKIFPVNHISGAFLASALGAIAMSGAHADGPILTDRRFTMEVQIAPFTHPQNPRFREVTVDCSKLGVSASGNLIMSGEFADQWDIPPLRKKIAGGSPAAEGTAALVHLGSLSPESHQYCVAQAEIFNGKAQFQNTNYPLTINGTTYHTSVPFTDDRYCPVFAAMKTCTATLDDDKKLSPVYDWDPANNRLRLVPENL